MGYPGHDPGAQIGRMFFTLDGGDLRGRLEQQINGDENLVESLKRQLKEAEDRLRSRRADIARLRDVVKSERAEERVCGPAESRCSWW